MHLEVTERDVAKANFENDLACWLGECTGTHGPSSEKKHVVFWLEARASPWGRMYVQGAGSASVLCTLGRVCPKTVACSIRAWVS